MSQNVNEIHDLIMKARMLLEHPDMGGTNLSKALRNLKEAEKLCIESNKKCQECK